MVMVKHNNVITHKKIIIDASTSNVSSVSSSAMAIGSTLTKLELFSSFIRTDAFISFYRYLAVIAKSDVFAASNLNINMAYKCIK